MIGAPLTGRIDNRIPAKSTLNETATGTFKGQYRTLEVDPPSGNP